MVQQEVQQGALSPVMERFIQAVAEIVEEGGGEYAVTARVADELREVAAAGPGTIPLDYRRPQDDRYAMYPIHVAPDGSFSVAAAIWGVGQTTPIHDHGTWGVIGILDGTEHEIRYRPPVEPGQAPPLRLDDRHLNPGDVDVCCTTDQDVHQVSCASETPTVAIHVYGADIGRLERRTYDPATGQVTMFVSSWSSSN